MADIDQHRTVRNPAWTHDEQVLALDLYLRSRREPVTDPQLAELSVLLGQLPIHPNRETLRRFRSISAVRLKLANFAALDPTYPGIGMRASGRGDAEVWDRYNNQPEYLAALAAAIRRVAALAVVELAEPGEDEAPEGRLLYRFHALRERDRRLVERRKHRALQTDGTLACEACGFDFFARYGAVGTGYIECHHLLPLAWAADNHITRLADLALLCANCHRMAHRLRPWPAVSDVTALLR